MTLQLQEGFEDSHQLFDSHKFDKVGGIVRLRVRVSEAGREGQRVRESDSV